jgi:dTDP-4-amino-4,6-dideoxygalactose transaminase
MKKTIPLFKVFMSESVMEPLKKVLLSSYIGQGPQVELFEKLLTDYLNNRCVLTLNNGTSGLHLALRLAGVGYGDEVITTPLTCTATNWPILANGASPIWADIDPATANIDYKAIEALVTKKTKAIMMVHWGGYPCEIDEINTIANRFNLKTIEDCAHAFGAKYKGKMVGNHSDFCCFSFQAIKHFTTVDGGMLTCKDEAQYRRGKLLRWYGIDRESPRQDFRCEEDIQEWGYKFHMNDICATIGIEQLKFVDKILSSHRANARYYSSSLKNMTGITFLEEKPDRIASYWLYTMKVERREDFVRHMKECGIAVSRVHERNDKHTCVSQFKRNLPRLEDFVKTMICIPVGWWVEAEDREYVVDCIKKGW